MCCKVSLAVTDNFVPVFCQWSSGGIALMISRYQHLFRVGNWVFLDAKILTVFVSHLFVQDMKASSSS